KLANSSRANHSSPEWDKAEKRSQGLLGINVMVIKRSQFPGGLQYDPIPKNNNLTQPSINKRNTSVCYTSQPFLSPHCCLLHSAYVPILRIYCHGLHHSPPTSPLQ